MKKLIVTLVATALFAPAALFAQKVSTSTHFEGDRITGIDASSAFKVVLVKSLRNKAVVEVNDILVPYLHVSRSGDGIVSVSLRDTGSRIWREINRIPSKERVMKVTLYTSTVNTIRLSGAAEMTTSEAFSGENVDIQLSGASSIKGFGITSARVKLQASGASRASMVLSGTDDLVVIASGASDVDIAAAAVAYSKLGASGASVVRIKGDGNGGSWDANGASNIRGDEFAAKELTAIASGASSVHCNVSGKLTANSSGASSIRYRGNPASIVNNDNSVRPL